MPSQTLPILPAPAPMAPPRPRPPQPREGDEFAQCLAAEEKAAAPAPGEKKQPRKAAAGAANTAEKAEHGPETEKDRLEQILPPEPAMPQPATATAPPSSTDAGNAQQPGTVSPAALAAAPGTTAAQGTADAPADATTGPHAAQRWEMKHAAAGDAPVAATRPEMMLQRQPVENPAGTSLPAAPLSPPAMASPTIAASQPPPAAAQHATATPEALPLTIATAVQGDIKVMVIRLDPADLGHVQVQLELGEDGLRRAHLIVERPATLQQLMQDAPRLEQALASTGSGGADISFSLKQEASQNAGQPDQRQNGCNGPARTPQPGDDAGGTPEHPAARLLYRRNSTAAARLDMLA